MTADRRSTGALIAGAVMLALAGTAMASAEDELLARLRRDYPGTSWDAARPSVIPGLVEVVTGRNVVYAEPSGRYVVFGHIWDLRAQADLTAAAKQALAKIEATALPPADALIVRRSDHVTRRVSVFSDPSCGYCRVLERTLNDLPQLEVALYLTPMQPGSRALAASIWCSTDAPRAWLAQMLNDIPPEAADCDSAVLDRNLALARALGVQGTPTLIAPDGRVLAGAVSAPEILAWLDRAPLEDYR